MLEIVFLGTGSGIPSKARNPSSIWVRYEDNCMLWDCGEGTQRQLMKAKLSFMKIDNIFITHWHADHWAGLIGLLQTMNMEGRKKTLHIYGPDAERFVSDILELGYWGPRFQIKAIDVPFEGTDINTILKTKDFEIDSIPVNHTIPAVAYAFREKDRYNVDIKKAEKKYGLKQSPLIGKLKKRGSITYKGKHIKLKDVADLTPGTKAVYTGDTKSCPNLVKISEDADLLIHDATFESGKKTKMHSGAKDAGNTAKKAGAKKLILTHFSRRYVDVSPLVKEARKVFKNTKAAKDFMKVRLKHQ